MKNTVELLKKVCVFVFVLLFLFNTAFADLLTAPGSKPDVASTLYQVGVGGGYVESSNGFDDGNPQYYLLTQDQSKALNTTIDFDGKSYNLAGVNVVDANTGLKTLTNLWAVNRTVFVDSGTYLDDSGYYQFSHENLSIVGLNPSDKPIFKRAKTGTYFMRDITERHGFTSPNIYIRNIIFDGNSLNLRTNSRAIALIVVSGGLNADGSFYNEGAQNFVIKDCDIINVGSVTSSTFDNRAIQMLYGKNQVNIEGLKISNVKTSQNGGAIHTNSKSNVYIKDLNLDNSAASPYSFGLRIENAQLSVPVKDNSVVMDGTNILSTKFVQVQDYTYEKINIPMEFRYIAYYNTNGNPSVGTYRVVSDYNIIPDTARTRVPRLDRLDNYWIVDENSSMSVEQQIADIATVREYMKKVVNVQGYALPKDRIPPMNIKLIVKDGEINSFNIPANVVDDINIVAVNQLDSNANTSKMLIPVVSDFVSNFNNNSNTNIFNFDFANKAKYTIEETVNGFAPAAIKDAYNGSYPVGENLNYSEYGPAANVTPRIISKNPLNSQNFGNCNFVVLISELSVKEENNKTVLIMGETYKTKTVVENMFSSSKPVSNALSEEPLDKTYFIMALNPEVATIDSNGVITPVSLGTAKFLFKAKDGYNNGEIEKPYGILELKVEEAPTPTPKATINNQTIQAPKTGDNTNTTTIIVIAAIALLLGIVVAIKFKKK